MEINSPIKELIVKYLLDETDAKEDALVLEWINADPQHGEYLNELENVLRLIAARQASGAIDVNAEWIRFQQALAAKHAAEASFKEQAESAIVAEKPKRSAAVYKILIPGAIAASIILVVTILSRDNEQHTTPVVHTDSQQAVPQVIMHHEKNITEKTRRLLLGDGSEVMLFRGSEVIYPEPFAGNKRDITLKGKASFNVAKDKTRPFTVFTEDISTTALGTAFTVTNFRNDSRIMIRLMEGKVVVRSVDSASKKLGTDFYLLPGNELVYDKEHSTARIRNFRTEKPMAGNNANNDQPLNDSPLLPQNDAGSWYMFNNQSLEQVFDQLQEMYHEEIVYSKKDIRNKYFIGKFNKSDSLESILKKIASLNNLKVTRSNNKFTLSR